MMTSLESRLRIIMFPISHRNNVLKVRHKNELTVWSVWLSLNFFPFYFSGETLRFAKATITYI